MSNRYNSATEHATSSGQNSVEDHEALPGIDPDEVLQRDIEELPYISKSRVKTYVQCPAKFYWKYWCEERTPGSYHTEKGWKLHDTFEEFHLNLFDYMDEENDRPAWLTDVMPDEWSHWAQWPDHLANFLRFEERRWTEAAKSVQEEPFSTDWDQQVLDRWRPVEVEAEAWLGEPPQSWLESERGGEPDYVSGEPPISGAPWMGRADLIADSRSVPGVDGDGVTIIDYKTGSCPTVRYEGHSMLDQILNEGIYLEGEYYGMLFEPFYKIDAVAGYYPQVDELVVSPYPNQSRRDLIMKSVEEMQVMPKKLKGNGPPSEFPHEEQPLCNYGSGNCHFYNICPSTYGQ